MGLSLLIWLVAYTFFMFLQAIFINGIKISASGETIKSPSGRDIDSEMILYPVKKYLCQFKMFPEYYSGPQLEDLLKKIEAKSFVSLNAVRGIYAVPANLDHIVDWDKITRQLVSVDPEIKVDASDPEAVMFFKEMKAYRFSKYIRKPIIQCVICMASFWGFFTYWIPVYYAFGFSVETFILWIANTICLSFVNYLIFKDH